jgi:tRNA modification GTPase
LPADATYVACLTPSGTGAIATLAVVGPQAWNMVRERFQPLSATQALPLDPQPGQFQLGRLGQTISDTVVLSVRPGARTNWIELHCHGGRQVVEMLLDLFAAAGAQPCTWEQLERSTNPDPLQALAACTLVEARTARTAAILLDQYHGALARALTATLAALRQEDRAAASQQLAELVRYAGVGRHLTHPWRVVIAGAPNVGKSSLLNALAGYQRSIVAPTPGTTRDVVTTLLAIDGWPIEVADTAGLRVAAEGLEEQGMRQAQTAAAEADLCLWVLDAAAPPVWPPFVSPTLRFVTNKMDLPAAWDLAQAAGAVQVSAHTGAGLPELCQAIGRWLVPESPPAGAPVPFTPQLCDQIEQAHQFIALGSIDRALRAIGSILFRP